MSILHENKNDLAALSGGSPKETAHGIRTVLVVDDNVDAADSLGQLLTAWGYEVIVAHDGPAALAALQDLLPDIALLDIGMPCMDGYELASHLPSRARAVPRPSAARVPRVSRRTWSSRCIRPAWQRCSSSRGS